MSSYIDKNLKKYGRVETGWAQRFQSDRIFNANEMLCPPRIYVDNMGRQSEHYALDTTTAGCNSATDRVYVEDAQRPSNFTSATLNALGIQGGYTCDDLEMANKAMAFQYRNNGNVIIPDQRVYYSQRAREEQWRQIGLKVRHYKEASGCL